MAFETRHLIRGEFRGLDVHSTAIHLGAVVTIQAVVVVEDLTQAPIGS
jgi:hypothetical protein